MGYDTGSDRLLLRHPQVVSHRITPDSPLQPWVRSENGVTAEAQLVIVLEGVTFCTSANMVTTATLRLPQDLRHNHTFCPMMQDTHGDIAAAEASLDWSKFHCVEPATVGQTGAASTKQHMRLKRLSAGQGRASSVQLDMPAAHVTAQQKLQMVSMQPSEPSTKPQMDEQARRPVSADLA